MENSIYKIPIKEYASLAAERTLDMFLKVPAFQRYVNRRANDKYGQSFVNHNSNVTIDDVFRDYRFNDIQKDDIVLDIGANVGAFSLFVSRMVEHVYAVEPMLTDVLKENVVLNGRNNITVLNEALGRGMVEIPWEGCRTRHIVGKSLSELIFICGGDVDFLKMDCEGGEWCIKPMELDGIRRIEAEVHNFGEQDLNKFLKMLEDAGFGYDYNNPRSGILFVHAFREMFW